MTAIQQLLDRPVGQALGWALLPFLLAVHNVSRTYIKELDELGDHRLLLDQLACASTA